MLSCPHRLRQQTRLKRADSESQNRKCSHESRPERNRDFKFMRLPFRQGRRSLAWPLLLILFIFAFAAPFTTLDASARQRRGGVARRAQGWKPKQAPKSKPRLVLLIAVDQFRYDYLER